MSAPLYSLLGSEKLIVGTAVALMYAALFGMRWLPRMKSDELVKIDRRLISIAQSYSASEGFPTSRSFGHRYIQALLPSLGSAKRRTR